MFLSRRLPENFAREEEKNSVATAVADWPLNNLAAALAADPTLILTTFVTLASVARRALRMTTQTATRKYSTPVAPNS